MGASIDYLPIWKKGATAAERFFELGEIARKYPERFEKFVIAYTETMPNGNLKVRNIQYGCTLFEQVGLFETGKAEALKDSER